VPEVIPTSTFCCGATITMCGDPARALRASKEDRIMEIAAAVLVGTVVLWFVEEAADEHV